MPVPSCSTASFRLREITSDDVRFIQALTQAEGWLQNIGPRGTETMEGTYAYIERSYTVPYREKGFGLWGIECLMRGQLVGVNGILLRPGLEVPELGFALLPEEAGKGWIQHTGRCILDHAKNVLHFPLLDAYANVDNARSRASLNRLGFHEIQCGKHPSFDADVCHARIQLFQTP